jgi:Fur family peroxide stress response transcriptional regulator
MTATVSFISAKLADMEALCRAKGMPLTVQRRVILEELAGRSDHPTADQIFDSVGTRMPGISRTTVYRVLDALVGLEVVQKINNPDARSRFDADTSRHHHVRCSVCGTVADVRDERLNQLPLPDPAPGGFQFLDYSINFTGTCTDCRKG